MIEAQKERMDRLKRNLQNAMMQKQGLDKSLGTFQQEVRAKDKDLIEMKESLSDVHNLCSQLKMQLESN